MDIMRGIGTVLSRIAVLILLSAGMTATAFADDSASSGGDSSSASKSTSGGKTSGATNPSKSSGLGDSQEKSTGSEAGIGGDMPIEATILAYQGLFSSADAIGTAVDTAVPSTGSG